MIQITPTSDIFYVEYNTQNVITDKILTLKKGTNLLTNANCTDLGLFNKAGMNEIIVADTFEAITQRIADLGLTYTAEAQIELFPYEGRNIRVFISDNVLRKITKSEYKPLIDMALLVPAMEETNDGTVVWLERFGNEYYTDAQVEAVLRSFNAQILIK